MSGFGQMDKLNNVIFCCTFLLYACQGFQIQITAVNRHEKIFQEKAARFPSKFSSSLRCSMSLGEKNEISRRNLLGTLLLNTAFPKRSQASTVLIAPPQGRPRNIIITGANSGIGKNAAGKLAAAGYNIILACRTLERAKMAQESLEAQVLSKVSSPGKLIPMECNLASFASIRKFVSDFHSLSIPLDVLVCNAGVALGTDQKPPPPRTLDGYELTVGTNHLGHFLLANLLLPDLERAAPGARLVITASQVHDPSSPGGNVGSRATLGDMGGLALGRPEAWDMVDGGAYDADKAYKDSKLCNVLFAREMHRRLTARAAGGAGGGGAAGGLGVTCNSFSPGLITESGLFRNQNPLFVAAFGLVANQLVHVGETVDFGGDCLARMAAGPDLAGAGGVFYSNSRPGQHTFEETRVSAEAADSDKARRLWELSARAVGLSG